jgi:hypothetical protein
MNLICIDVEKGALKGALLFCRIGKFAAIIIQQAPIQLCS